MTVLQDARRCSGKGSLVVVVVVVVVALAKRSDLLEKSMVNQARSSYNKKIINLHNMQ